MKLIAVKPVRYGGKRYEVGQEVPAVGRWADLMQRSGQLRVEGEEPAKRGRGRPRKALTAVAGSSTLATETEYNRRDITEDDTDTK